jgi:hypothetical protein
MSLLRKRAPFVIPIWLTPGDYEHALFGKLQPFPAGYRPVSVLPDCDEALRQVNLQIREVIKQCNAGPADNTVRQPQEVELGLQVAEDDPAALLPHMCDRTDQDIGIRQLFCPEVDVEGSDVQPHQLNEEAGSAPQATRPYVFIVHGRDIDCPDGFKMRLENVLLPELLKHPSALTPIPLGDWPRDFQSEASAKSDFEWRVASSLGCKPSAILKALRPGTPTLITVRMRDTQWRNSGEELFCAFLRFWQEFPDLPPEQSLIIAIFIEYKGPDYTKIGVVDTVFGGFIGKTGAQRLERRVLKLHSEIDESLERLKRLQSYNNIRGTILRRLNLIEREYALNWIDHLRVRVYCRPNSRLEMITEVRAQFGGPQEEPKPKPMGDLVLPLTQILVKHRKRGH